MFSTAFTFYDFSLYRQITSYYANEKRINKYFTPKFNPKRKFGCKKGTKYNEKIEKHQKYMTVLWYCTFLYNIGGKYGLSARLKNYEVIVFLCIFVNLWTYDMKIFLFSAYICFLLRRYYCFY